MIDQTNHVLAGRGHDRTPIGIHFGSEHRCVRRLLELADENHWQLVNMMKFSGSGSGSGTGGIHISGALVALLPSDPRVAAMVGSGVPIARIGAHAHPNDDLIIAVIPDRKACGARAAEHFAERGFTDVAFVGTNPWGPNQALYAAFEGRAGALGCTAHLWQQELDLPQRDRLPPSEKHAFMRGQFTDWLMSLPRPVGLLANTPQLADRYCQWVLDAGLAVPEDVAVLSVGDDRITTACAPVPISSIMLDYDRMAEVAVDVLKQRLAGRALDQTTIRVPPANIITRRSSDVLAASDPSVVAALQFMWDHVAEDLSVDQIAKRVGTSRRSLERAFERQLGRGINAEFQRRRLEKARELIRHSDLSIGQVADALSFSSHSQFSRAFRAAYGLSPAAFRRQLPPSA